MRPRYVERTTWKSRIAYVICEVYKELSFENMVNILYIQQIVCHYVSYHLFISILLDYFS